MSVLVFYKQNVVLRITYEIRLFRAPKKLSFNTIMERSQLARDKGEKVWGFLMPFIPAPISTWERQLLA